VSDFCPDRRAVERFRFALIDATYREDLPSSWPCTVVAPSFLDDDTDRCPVLVDLPSLPDVERAEWCDALHEETLAMNDTRASLLLASDGTAQGVAAHMARRMTLRLPNQTHPMQWRYFDPGTLLQMPRVLGQVGMAWLMGPVSSIMVPWAGEWTRLDRPASSWPAQASTFKLSDTHLAALLRIGIVNRVGMACPPPGGATAWTDQCATLDKHVVNAQEKHGLTQRDDLIAFALHAHTVHPDIHRHLQMQHILAAIREPVSGGCVRYADLTGALQPQDWQSMLADLSHIPTREAPQP
jgi:hypothetical protein